MSCGRLALERAGIKIKNYFASEIDKYAIQVARANYPDTIHLGDVRNVSWFGLPKIDLLIGGSPCQGFSFAGKQLNFNDPRSALFFEFVRILKEVQPKYFLLENVNMKKEYQNIISEYLGVQPIMINSALVSAQNRKRLYWTNIPGVTQPKDKGILLKDIIDNGLTDREKSLVITTRVGGATVDRYLNKSMHQMIQVANANPSGIGMNGRIFSTAGKRPTLTTNKGEGFKIVQRPRGFNKGGEFTEKSPTLTSCSWQDNNKVCIRVGTAKDITGHDYNKRIYSTLAKSPTLTSSAGGNKTPKIAVNDTLYYRKITPEECEALQTVPRGYTACVSNSQRYIMLGNGWTIDIIAHIFSFMK